MCTWENTLFKIFKMGYGKLTLHHYKKSNFKHFVIPLLIQVHELSFYWEHNLQNNIFSKLDYKIEHFSNTNFK